MTDTPPNAPRDSATGMSQSGDLSGISEMFGLRDGQTADTGTRTGTDTVGRWVAATSGDALAPADASGRLVHGRYRLIAELGVGGMGVTYRAWDTTAGIPVVVKMPRREVRSDSEAMQRFAREIDAMLAVPHERIVPITDHGDDDGCPFVVMRFLPGGSLADYRRRDEAGNAIRNPPGMLHFWLPGVAAALDHIHARGMLHRDVKPGNIFLDGFLKPYLGDFGIAKVVDESGGLAKEQTLTATKMAVGTPEYMAPELFKPRSKPDGRVDQYALAVTVYEMLSGEKPFKGDRAHIIVEHSAMPMPPLSGKVPGLPQSLCMAVEKGLAKTAADRFQTCGEFAAAVVAELAVLPPESDTVRLLCPSCKNILKLPQKAAGKTGRCPRCREAVDVAADLGSLWLEAEERGGGLTATGDTATPSSPLEKLDDQEPQSAPLKKTWRVVHWAAVGAAAIASLIAGSLWGGSRQQARAAKQHAEEVRRLEGDADDAKMSQRDAEGKVKDLEQRVRDQENTIAKLEKAKTERDSLAVENQRLTKVLAAARTVGEPKAPSPVPATSDTGRPLPGQALLMAMKNVDGERKDLERWGGKGRVVYGKIDGVRGDEVACYTRLWPDGSFATSLHPGRSVTFYTHGCERLVAPLNNEVQPQICDAGVLSFSRCPPDRLRSVRGTVSPASREQESVPTRVSLSIRNNHPVYDDWGHRGAQLSVGVDSSEVKPGGSFAFEGLSRIPYYLTLTRPNYIARDIEINPEEDGVIDLGDLVVEKAPVLDIRYRARLRPKGKDWLVDQSVQSTSLVCDDRTSFKFSDARDSYGNTLALRMAPKPDGVVASFFYRSGEPFFDLGSDDIATIADFDTLGQRTKAQGRSEMSLKHGHVYLFKIAHMEGTEIELFFQPHYR